LHLLTLIYYRFNVIKRYFYRSKKRKMTKKSLAKLILKITLSAGALYYVGSRLDLIDIWEKIKSANIFLLVLALVVYSISQVAAAARLKGLFFYIPLQISHKENIKLYWLGLFYNLFLPGGVGGDGFKVFLLGKHLKAELKKVIGAILSDRVSGLSVIVIMLLIFIPFIDYHIPYQKLAWIFIPFVIIAFYLFLHIFIKTLKPAFTKVLTWALVVQLLQMLSAILILLSMKVLTNGYYTDYLFLFFLSAIAGAVPITLGGIGAREFVFMWGAIHLGVDQASAVALSLLFYSASAITALPGIIFTFKSGKILERNNN
jgi:glycosyltransferase 2 family protein